MRLLLHLYSDGKCRRYNCELCDFKEVVMKRIVSVALLVVICLSLQGCGSIKKAEEQVDRLLSFIDSGNIEKLSLKISYIDPMILTRFPWQVDNLLSSDLLQKIEVGRQELSEHIESLRLLEQASLKKPEQESVLNARMYYYFEASGKKLLEVALWGTGTEITEDMEHTVFIGDIAVVDPDSIFLKIIEPFLPEEYARYLKE
jgi:hypothetical protein